MYKAIGCKYPWVSHTSGFHEGGMCFQAVCRMDVVSCCSFEDSSVHMMESCRGA